MSKFIRRWPILAAVLFPLAVFFVIDEASLLISSLTYGLFAEDVLHYFNDILAYLPGIIVALLLLRCCGLRNDLGLRRKGFWSGLLYGGLLMVTSVYDLVEYARYLDPGTFHTPTPLLFFMCLLDIFLIGFTEELIFRAGVLNILLARFGNTKKGLYGSVLFSSALFGAVHFTNYLYYPQMFWSTMSQMVYATFFGVLIGAAYAKARNLWASATLHTVFNLSLILSVFSQEAAALEMTDVSPLSAVYSVLTSIPFLVMGLILLQTIALPPGQKNDS